MYKQIPINQSQDLKPPMHGSQKWISRLNQIMETALYNPQVNNLKIAKELNVSERDLFRKVKRTTGLSPQKYLRRYRMIKAMEHLTAGKYRTVKETGCAIGYENTSYFIVLFEKEFGKKPLQVLKEHGWR